MKQIELTLACGDVRLKIVSDGKTTDMMLTGNPTPTQRKAVEQLRGKGLDAMTTLKLLYKSFYI